MTTFLHTDGDGHLACPRCGDTWVHIDEVFVAGRAREDGEVLPVHVDAGGRIAHGAGVALPIPDVGRRHVIALQGWCEQCAGPFTIEFKQHKGQTEVSVREPRWDNLTPLTT